MSSVKSEARSNFAAQHLAAAKYFQSQLAEIERTGHPSKEHFAPVRYLHYWSAAVVFAVMAMEANAHDLMTSAERGKEGPLERRRFRAEDHREPLLERYNLLHKVAMRGVELPLDRGIWQEARALVLFRDEIVHYKTEWRSVATVSKRLESMLRTRFTLNPFRCGEVFFPEQCVSGSSAMWAVRVAQDFMLSFATITKYRLNV